MWITNNTSDHFRAPTFVPQFHYKGQIYQILQGLTKNSSQKRNDISTFCYASSFCRNEPHLLAHFLPLIFFLHFFNLRFSPLSVHHKKDTLLSHILPLFGSQRIMERLPCNHHYKSLMTFTATPCIRQLST